MERIWIVLLVVAVAFAIVLPAGAKKPDKPGGKGFKPMACEVEVPFVIADVRNAAGTKNKVPADEIGEFFTLTATALGGFNETLYTVDPETLDLTLNPGDVLCVEVTLLDGTLGDLRVRWLECQDPCLYWLRGKDLRNFNNLPNGEVFAAGVSVADLTDPGGEKTVAVMPVAKSDSAEMTVKIGIDQS
jgi:hypothetical protein